MEKPTHLKRVTDTKRHPWTPVRWKHSILARGFQHTLISISNVSGINPSCGWKTSLPICRRFSVSYESCNLQQELKQSAPDCCPKDYIHQLLSQGLYPLLLPLVILHLMLDRQALYYWTKPHLNCVSEAWRLERIIPPNLFPRAHIWVQYNGQVQGCTQGSPCV